MLISSNMHWIIVQLQLTVARWLLWPASSRLLRNPSIGSGYRSSGLSGLWRSSHHLGLSFDFQKTFSEIIASLAPLTFLVQTVSSGDYIKMRVRLFYWAFVWSLKCVFFLGNWQDRFKMSWFQALFPLFNIHSCSERYCEMFVCNLCFFLLLHV